ncbi:hypothetical protein [Paraburkholderia lycopersici]|uniref:Uncharacterized protein n=1 Tax=Paraburkholderia lycopersici TaxID=416944 RepID=A0A1G6LUH6_9BURK|nr:hypothetical protein [Paraburkholderia lycopersici]SDC46724.1 hypothetical protein SAMN05421548_10741 [Paraburkholderia lycopersici]
MLTVVFLSHLGKEITYVTVVASLYCVLTQRKKSHQHVRFVVSLSGLDGMAV